MMAIAEGLIDAEGLGWAFCDTDSMAIAKPRDMPEEVFGSKTTRVQNWFTPLNPYEVKGPLLQTESVNQSPPKSVGEATPLHCFAVSAKRYALFNVDPNGRPLLRKASAHGLGHLLDPYDDAHAPVAIPTPAVPLKEIGVRRWQYDVWYRIVEALAGRPDEPDFALPNFDKAALSRYAATTPELLRWFKTYNTGRPYTEQVRPFGFMLALQADKRRSGRITRQGRVKVPKPVAPFATPHVCEFASFDRETGVPVSFCSRPTEILSAGARARSHPP